MSHPYLMIKILSEKKKIPVSCTHGRMCAFGRYAPEIKKTVAISLFFHGTRRE